MTKAVGALRQQQAEGEEAQVREERGAREGELATAEATKQQVDAEELEAKKRRDELKAFDRTTQMNIR